MDYIVKESMREKMLEGEGDYLIGKKVKLVIVLKNGKLVLYICIKQLSH